jgi:hypothetical protein
MDSKKYKMFRGELRGDRIQVMLGTIQSKTCCLLVCYLKAQKLEYTKLLFLSVFLYGYETWSPTLMEEHRLRAFENRVPRGML